MEAPMVVQLTVEQQNELLRLEYRIQQGLSTFNDVGAALAEIRDKRLYRGTHSTFEDYCRDRWGFTGRFANYQIQAAQVVKNLGTTVPVLPATETQARPLAPLEPEVQREVWTRAVETAPEGKITAKHITKTVTEWTYNQGVVYGADASTYKEPAPEPNKLPPKPVPTDDDTPKTVTLRVARVVYLMTLGRWMTLEEISGVTGLTENGAWRLMDRLAGGHHVPVTDDPETGKWGILESEARDWAY